MSCKVSMTLTVNSRIALALQLPILANASGSDLYLVKFDARYTVFVAYKGFVFADQPLSLPLPHTFCA